MSKHRWDKLDTHLYRCRQCGLQKLSVPQERAGSLYPEWATVFRDANGHETRGLTPPCPSDTPAAPAPLPAVASPASDRSLGQWNGYVEQGATLTERRARLAEVPEHLQGQVKDHLVTVFALKDAARLRGKGRSESRA
jgi:hypothetical protein